MILENTEITKYTFSGHDSFQCRQLWLKKGYDYVQEGKNFNDEDAVVQLGVGKNMVSSIRFWLKAFNIIDNKDIPTVHQSLESYAYGLSKTQQQEWTKVKGRFREITFNEPVEQLLFLINLN